MPVLLVPPTQVVPYDAERMMRQRQAMDEFRANVVKLWDATPGEEVKFGAFRRARNYSWNESFDGLLQTYFIFPAAGKVTDKELARVVVLFRKDNCQMLGSRVIWGFDWSSSLPSGMKRQELSELKAASARKFESPQSPIRLSVETFGYWGQSMAWLTEAVVGERLSAAGFSVHSDLSGLACFRESLNSAQQPNQPNSQPSAAAKQPQPNQSQDFSLKKGHRQIKIRLDGVKPKSPQKWAEVGGQMKILTLPFNAQRKSIPLVDEKQKQTLFDPEKIAERAASEIATHMQQLKDRQIKVLRRSGRFVTVDRGIAYGLKIGMHLSGPDGAQLHVIRFEPSADNDDAAILLIRKESAQQPLAAGAVLQIDQTQYPKSQ